MSGLICVSVGADSPNAIAYRSSDGGDTWSSASVGNIPLGATSATFRKVFCDSIDASQCVAVGTYQQGGTQALVNISSDGGQNWTLPVTPPSSNNGLLALACDNAAQRCTSAGANTFYTSDGGSTWWSSSITSPAGIVRAMACDNENSMNCAAVGNNGSNTFAKYTTDSGVSWVLAIITPTLNITLQALGCSTDLSQCIAMQGASYSTPVNIFQSTNKGVSWNQIAPLQITNPSNMFDMFCDGNGQICTAVGAASGTPAQVGISYYSLNGGASWTASNLPVGSVILLGISGGR